MSVEKIRNLIVENKLDQAFKEMQRLSANDSDLSNSIVLLTSRHNANEKNNRLSIITTAEYSRTQNQIKYAALETLREFKDVPGMEDIPAVIEPTIEQGPYPPGPTQESETDTETKVVFLASNPLPAAQLQLEKEYSRINQKVTRVDNTRGFRVLWHDRVTPSSFTEYLEIKNLDIVHFSGHGDKGGEEILAAMTRAGRQELQKSSVSLQSGIWLSEENSITPKRVSASFVKRAFKNAQQASNSGIKAVVFNACHSEEIAKAVSQVVEYVVGTSWKVRDDAAIAFAQAFYGAIAKSNSSDKNINIKWAVNLGITAALAYDEPEDRFRLYQNGKLIEV